MKRLMNSYSRSVSIILLAFILPAFPAMYGCSQNNAESQKVTDRTDSDPGVAELLDAVGVYRFNSPVKAPDFNLSSVEGNTVSIRQFQGKVVLLSFWATW